LSNRIRFSLVLCVILTGLLTACGSSTPKPAATVPTETSVPATATIAPTETPLPTATATTLPTATPTETPEPTATLTPVPSMTPSATATALPKATPTRKPTVVPATTTPAPTTAPVASSNVVPPPQVLQFNSNDFKKSLDYAHTTYQLFLANFGSVAKGNHTGSCSWLFQRQGAMMSLVAFTGAPEPWTAMVDEYNASRTQVLTAIEPLMNLCRGGGGTIPEGLDREIIDLFERLQNRMYEILKVTETMP
jgi:hypothetical protein